MEMDKKSYLRQVPRIDLDATLFPPEKAARKLEELMVEEEILNSLNFLPPLLKKQDD